MPSSKPDTPHPCRSHATGHHDADPRPHVAALITLGALGWYVTAIRPDRTQPVLWRVTIERFDGYASISVKEADPDDALDEVLRYAAIDREADINDAPDAAARAAAAEGLSDPDVALNKRTSEATEATANAHRSSDPIDGGAS
jgi:hypothetical protein